MRGRARACRPLVADREIERRPGARHSLMRRSARICRRPDGCTCAAQLILCPASPDAPRAAWLATLTLQPAARSPCSRPQPVRARAERGPERRAPRCGRVG